MNNKENFVTKLSVSSVKNFRLTLLAFIGIIFIGFITYTNLLPREGFPELEFPTAFVQTIYPINDPNIIDSTLTTPLVDVIKIRESVEVVNSTSADNFSFIIISFKTGTDTEEEVAKINEEISRLELPEGVNPEVISLQANAVDGENDLILGVVSKEDNDVLKLQEVSKEIASEFNSLNTVDNSSTINLFEEIYSPLTGKEELLQLSFNRYGKKENGEIKINESILLGIQKESNVTTTELSSEVTEKLESINESGNYDGYEIVTVYDEAVGLNEQITSLESNAFSALIIVALTLFLFVSWRAAIVAVIFIPTVMAATFITLLLLGVSLNVISLFALILVLGLLVDDAIVIVESIDYHKREGLKGIKAVKAAINSVGKADAIGTITTLLVFFPMLFIIGFLGEIIRDVPITVITTLSWSLIIALTIVPLLSNVIIPTRKPGYRQNPLYWVFNIFNELVLFYGKVLGTIVGFYVKRWYLNILIIFLGITLIGLGGYFASKLQFVDFPPQKDSNGIYVNFTFENGLTILEKENIVKEVEEVITDNYSDLVEEIKYPQVGRDFSGADTAFMMVKLTSLLDRSETSVEIAEAIEGKLEETSRAIIIVQAEQVSGPPTVEYQSQIQIYGNDSHSLIKVAEEIREYILNDIDFENDITVSDSRIKNLDSIVKNDGRRFLLIESKLEGEVDDASIRLVSERVKEEYNSVKLQELGLEEDSLGDDRGFASEIFESVISAGVALLGSFVIIYLFLVVVFNSFSQALLIMLAIPFSFFGLFGGLYITDNPISFFVIIGMIALVGIVVNNTVMLLDFANQMRMEGSSISDSIIKAVKLRFRPLLTTSATTVLGLFPLALTEPLWESLAFVIIFGLLSSTFLVVITFPAFYVVIENLRKFIKGYIFRIEAYRK